MKQIVKIIGLIFIIIIFFPSCSDDNSTDPTQDNELTAEDFKIDVKEIEIHPNLQSAANEGSMGAMQVLSAIEIYNSLGEFSSQVVPESANKLSKVIHQQTIDGVTMTWETYKFADYIELEMTCNGTRQSDGTVFANFLKGQMIMFTDGSYCMLELFEDNSSSYLMSMEISEEDNGNYIVDFYYMGLMDMTITYIPDGMLEIVDVMADGTKWEATVFEDGTGIYRYFNADGSVWQEDTW